MSFRYVAEHPVSPSNHVGVAIRLSEGTELDLHVGIVFRLSDGTPWIAHLAFHEKLRDHAAPTGDRYAWADCRWLQTDEHSHSGPFVARFIQGTLRNRKVRYGLDPRLDCFSTGTYGEDDPRYGLTCATYVAAALKGAGIDLLDITTWIARPGDEAWTNAVLRALREGAPERAAELEGQRAPFRVRPDEVAAAAEGPIFPISMTEAEAGAKDLLNFLRGIPTSDE